MTSGRVWWSNLVEILEINAIELLNVVVNKDDFADGVGLQCGATFLEHSPSRPPVENSRSLGGLVAGMHV